MKTYEEFLYQKQLDESLFSRAVGAVNRVGKGLSKMGSAAGGAAKSVAKNVKTNVPKAVNQVKKTTTNVRKEVGKNSRPGRFGAARVLGNRNVRSGLSALKSAASGIRGKTYSGQSLGTAFQSGSGVGSEISQGVKDRKKFERSKTVQYNKPGGSASGQKLPTSRTVVQRGRELDSDGNAIDRGKRGESVLNKVTSKLRRNIGLSDVKDRTPLPPKPGESKPPTGGGKITGPEQSGAEATSGGKSKGTKPVSVDTGRLPSGGTEVDGKGKKIITKKFKPTETKGGARVTDGGGTRFTGDTTIEKGDDGKLKSVTQRPGENQKLVTTGNRQYFARKTDDPKRLNQTTKRPPGSIQSKITGDRDRSDIVTDVDKKGRRGSPGQAVRKPSGGFEKNKGREQRLMDKTPVIKGGVKSGDFDSPSKKETKPKVTTNKTETDKVGTPKASETKVTTNKTETKKPKSISQKIKDATEKGVNVDDGKGSYTPVVKKKETSDSKKVGDGLGKADPSKNLKGQSSNIETKRENNTETRGRKSGTPTQLSLMRSLNKDSAPSKPDERKKEQMQQQQMMNDPRRSGSDDLSDGGNPERGGSKPYKAPSKTESQNIQTKSVINQSRKKNKSGKKYSKGGGAESGGGNQKENRNPIKKKFVKLNKNKNKEEESTTSESFSHWREEFLWEVDKKYPDKVKEIKPMSGKNTITINPEDETSKYKRGY